jgi:2-hydroxy-6-oxonona-2,4-dienedioate hydrolase
MQRVFRAQEPAAQARDDGRGARNAPSRVDRREGPAHVLPRVGRSCAPGRASHRPRPWLRSFRPLHAPDRPATHGGLSRLCPDLPGFGDSDNPRDVLDVPQLADYLAAWIPTVGLDRASLLGNSFGCQVIADLAARHPDRVDRAIPATPDHASRRTILVLAAHPVAAEPADQSTLVERADPAGLPEGRCPAHVLVVPRADHRSYRSQGAAHPGAGAGGAGRARSRRQPALVPVIADLCPKGRLVVIPGVAHTLCYTAPVALAHVTGTFVTRAAS